MLAFTVLGRLALLPLVPRPQPLIADEFSHLLLADTLVSGRLSNPPHPYWEHFETLFVLHHPTYASVYPVGQGLILAAGIWMAHDPWIGVLLSGAIFCILVYWMLCGWMPPCWALLGGILASIQIEIFSYWMNSYWGGTPAAIGGALVFGSLPRLARRVRVRDSLLLGLGMAILANTRPYEGLVLSLCASFWWLLAVSKHGRRGRRGWAHAISRQVLPAVLILAVTAAAMGYYFRRVTGSPLRMPYQAYIAEYAAAPAFLFQPAPRTPEYRNETLRDAHLSFRVDYQQYASVRGFTVLALRRLGSVAQFYLGPLTLIVAVAGYCMIRSRRMRPLVISAVTVSAALLLTIPFQPHYAAPMAAILAGMAACGLRVFWLAQRRGIWIGRTIVLAAPLVCAAGQLLAIGSSPPQSRLQLRPGLERRLQKEGGQHLVIVRYESHHALAEEWVFNRANIDGSPIVWARDLGDSRNRELIRYYAGRRVWLLRPDRPSLDLVPYSDN